MSWQCRATANARFNIAERKIGNTTAANKLELELAPMICPTPSHEEIMS